MKKISTPINYKNMNNNYFNLSLKGIVALLFCMAFMLPDISAQVWVNVRTGTTYAHLRAAHDAATTLDGDVLQIITPNSSFPARPAPWNSSNNPVNVTKAVIIDGNGCTATNNSGSNTYQAMWLNFSGATNKTFTLRNMTLCSYSGGDGAAIGSSAGSGTTFVLQNVNVHASFGSNYAVSLYGSTTISNCNFSNNTKGALNVKIDASAVTVNISNSIFDCNGASLAGNGGGIAITSSGSNSTSSCSITGGSVSNNKGEAAGGIFYNCGKNTTLTINGTAINNNTCTSSQSASGAGIYANSASGTISMSVSNCSFEDNGAGAGSGAIHATGGVTTTVNSCKFRGNSGSNIVVVGASVGSSIFRENTTEYSTVGTNTITSVGSGNTNVFNFAGALKTSCAGGCSASLGGSASGVQVTIPGGSLDAGETLISSSTGLIFYRAADGTTGSFAITDPIPSSLGGKYVVFWQDVNEGLEGTDPVFAGTVAAAVLPVELTNFHALKKDQEIHLTWQTISESNNKGFHIERSKDSKNWESIGFIEGANDSHELLSYGFADKQPLVGMNYYRLQQLDLDGVFDYSEVKIVDMKGAESQIYPNPVQDHLILNIGTHQYAPESIQLFNFSGQLMTNVAVRTLSQDDEFFVPTAGLQTGIYFMKITYPGEVVETLRFIKK